MNGSKKLNDLVGRFRKRFRKPIESSVIDESLLSLLLEKFPKDARVLEAGSNTGHLSLKLGKKGYRISLVDILPEPIYYAKKDFTAEGVSGVFIIGDLFDVVGSWDGVWNSGVLQAYPLSKRDQIVGHIATLAPRYLAIFPDTGHPRFPKDFSDQVRPGIAGCREYSTDGTEKTFARFFKKVSSGVISEKTLGLPYPFQWFYGEN